ncbi:MAG: hypothetical protein UR43_C0019G0006 [candidate division TM6 bacterium GW2011_GWF2_33_332]|nr:MAG: hypothetical protein UR43_C0019G0006 [candidate division TM6 bacterium GW2011_GWF2_33_332]
MSKYYKRVKADNYVFGTNINGTDESGIMSLTNPPVLICLCPKDRSKVLLDSLNAGFVEAEAYEREFVGWWFTKGLMEFAIEAFSTPVLFIKFAEGSKKKYTLGELHEYWQKEVKQ